MKLLDTLCFGRQLNPTLILLILAGKLNGSYRSVIADGLIT